MASKRLKYPDEVVNFIRDRFRIMPDREISELLIIKFPTIDFKSQTVRSIRTSYKFIRNKKDKQIIMDRLVKQGVKKQAVFKMHETKGHAKEGDIRFTYYSNRAQWVIKINGKNRQYAAYLWEKHHGKLKQPYCAEWIDLEKPLTIENLRKRKYSSEHIAIGGITTWKHQGRVRELIKLGDGNYQLLLPYLWRKFRGDIPVGMWVEKIDPAKPTTIENLKLTRNYVIDEGSKKLDEWFLIGINSIGKSDKFKELLKNDKQLLELISKQLQLERLIKEYENGKSEKNTSDQSLDGPPAENA